MSPRSSRALCALAVLTLCATLRANVDQTFSIDTTDWQIQPKSMNVAGDFNGWSTDNTPMKVTGHKWSVVIDVEEGVHYYKFVVDHGTPDQRWINDPKADKSLEVSDGNGGNNSGVVAGVDVKKLPAPKPNDINVDAFRFDLKDQADWNLIDEHTARIRIRVLANDVQSITIQGEPSWSPETINKLTTEGGLDVYGGIVHIGSKTRVVIFDGTARGAFTPAEGKLHLTVENAKSIDGSNAVPLAPLAGKPPAWTADADWYQIFVDRFRNGDTSNDPGDYPYEKLIAWNADWFKTQPSEVPGDENFFHGAGNVWKRRYGGDLAGVREKLPYLRSLGINAIYLNPIFEAESMHKYDTADYRHVDDNFGVRDPSARSTTVPVVPGAAGSAGHERDAHATSEKPPIGNHELFNLDGSPVAKDYVETDDPKTWKWTKSDLLFLNVLKDAHDQGFHLILDGVFNHVGRAHPFFQDVLKNGKHSKYASWFDITDWGDEKNWHELADPMSVHGKPGGIQWRAWDGDNGYLPIWKKDAKTGLAHGPREHVLAIAARWGNPDGDASTDDGIDGWRLDAANEVPHPFWVDFRNAVHAAKLDSYIDGEIWSPSQAWVNDGKQFDAVMNYQFAMAAQAFFVNDTKQLKPSEFNTRLIKLWFMYPQNNAEAMQNLFDSHDTDRLASMFVNPDRPYDGENRPQDNAAGHPYQMRAPHADEWQRLLQAVAFQNTFIGAPMTYYGDEVGMWGADDPSDRQPLPWDDKGPYADGVGINKMVFAGFQRYIAIRNHFKALREGSFTPMTIDDTQNLYAFDRELGNEHVYVAINRSGHSRTIKLDGVADGAYIDYGDEKQVKVIAPKADDSKGRPTVSVDPAATVLKPTSGSLSIKLPPYSTAILATK